MSHFTFTAVIQRSTGWGAYVIFPYDTQQEFGIEGRVPVQAKLDGLPYTGSLMTGGLPHHQLGVPQHIREKLNKQPGDLITVELWHDTTPRTIEQPEAFLTLLRQHNLLEAFEALSQTRRKEYRNWLTTAKKEETRQRRLLKAIDLLKSELTTKCVPRS